MLDRDTPDSVHLLLVSGPYTQTCRLGRSYRYIYPRDTAISFINAWPYHADVCGFFFRETPSYVPPKALEAFLHNGPLPIYIGFGSIVVEDPEQMERMVLEAVRLTGVRAIISRGWSKLGSTESKSSDVYYIEDCPHEWLFEKVAAVVHHGGAGTTACGLRYGCPTTIIPFFGE